MIGTARESLERAHRSFRAMKEMEVLAAGHPVDVFAQLEVWRSTAMHLATVMEREALGPYCATLVGTGVDCLVYNSDALRKGFAPDAPHPSKLALADPAVEEVLVTVLVAQAGDLMAVVSPYRYPEPGRIEYGPPEWDTLLDAEVVDWLREAYR
jgi:hypothetical protein